MVMEVSGNNAPASVTALPRQTWQRDRHWFCPAAQALLTTCGRSSAKASSVSFTCFTSQPALAFLQDHGRHGQQCFPAAVPIQVSTFFFCLGADLNNALPLLCRLTPWHKCRIDLLCRCQMQPLKRSVMEHDVQLC